MKNNLFAKLALSLIVILLLVNLGLELRKPVTVSAQGRRQYEVVDAIPERLNEMGRQGFRLVIVYNGLAYMEK